jgi:AAA15 family ATPase/GTPase
MIQEIRIKNFLSFKDEVILNFEATSDKYLSEYYIHEPAKGIRLLKFLLIYGANASGKSNLINTITFLKNLITNIFTDKDEPIDFHPFAFDKTINKPGELELIFYLYSKKYRYKVVLDKTKIHYESLIYYPGTQPAVVFKRYYDKKSGTSHIEFGRRIKISNTAKEAIVLRTLKNISVFAAYSQVNISVEELSYPHYWLKNNFLNPIGPGQKVSKIHPQFIIDNPEFKEMLLKYLKKADFNISDIIFRKKEGGSQFDLFFEHSILKNNRQEFFTLPEHRESKGTLRFYAMLQPFINALMSDSFLSIDELGSSLHPLLVKHFIKDFLINSNSAQLLVTTHNLSLLNEKDILRKDAIWFTEKNEEGFTELYSAADFPDFRKELSFYNYYKSGKFGAVPNIE